MTSAVQNMMLLQLTGVVSGECLQKMRCRNLLIAAVGNGQSKTMFTDIRLHLRQTVIVSSFLLLVIALEHCLMLLVALATIGALVLATMATLTISTSIAVVITSAATVATTVFLSVLLERWWKNQQYQHL